MKTRPIIFSGEMVRAILASRKTQTRRVVRPQPIEEVTAPGWYVWRGENGWRPADLVRRCPYGVPGDRLWVRETFVLEQTDVLPSDGRPYTALVEPGEFGRYIVPHYRATEPEPYIATPGAVDTYDDRTHWRPSIHMPRWASRIALEVTGVRVEQVQDITFDDAMAEGCPGEHYHDMREPRMTASGLVTGRIGPTAWFADLWDNINAKRGYGWEANPWVWVVEFQRIVAVEEGA